MPPVTESATLSEEHLSRLRQVVRDTAIQEVIDLLAAGAYDEDIQVLIHASPLWGDAVDLTFRVHVSTEGLQAVRDVIFRPTDAEIFERVTTDLKKLLDGDS